MYVRSSIKFVALGVLVACPSLGACAHAPPPSVSAQAQMSARDMPELGEDTPATPQLVLARLSIDTPVARLCADPRAKAVLDSDLPGLTTRPEFPFFKNMSLKSLKKMSRGQMTDADLSRVEAGLARISSEPFDGER